MPSLFEFEMADVLTQTIDSHGSCSHACMNEQPFGIGEVEDKKLQRFDPEGYLKLQKLGVVTHQVEIDDIDLVASIVTALQHASMIDISKNNEHLYKHAIAVRTKSSMLIATGHAATGNNISISKKFGHKYICY